MVTNQLYPVKFTDESFNSCDRINVMYGGKIVESGATKDIFYNPQHPYIKRCKTPS